MTADRMQAFYLNIRKCLFHPTFANLGEENAKNVIKTVEGYRTVPSCKVDSLVEIAIHHLAADDAPSMEPSRQRPSDAFRSPPPSRSTSPLPQPPAPQQPQQDEQRSHQTSPPDKIVIYSYFLKNFELINLVSSRIGYITIAHPSSHITLDASAQQH